MSLAAYGADDGLVGHHWEEKPLGLAKDHKDYMPQYRGIPGPGSRSGWFGEQGAGGGKDKGDFQENI